MDNGKCSFLHAFYEDDWSRCPYPEQVKRYKMTDDNGRVYFNWYCDEGADEAGRGSGSMELCPQADGEPKP